MSLPGDARFVEKVTMEYEDKNYTNDDAYKCLDASTGSAVWKKTTP
jgi:hypothetical protein